MMDQMSDVISLHGDERSLGSRNSLGCRRSTRSSRSNKSSNRQRSSSKSTNPITGRQIRVNLISSGGNGEQRLPLAVVVPELAVAIVLLLPRIAHHIIYSSTNKNNNQVNQTVNMTRRQANKTMSAMAKIRIIAIASTISMLMMKCQLQLFLPVGTKTIITAGMDDKYRVSHRGETGATPR